MKLEITIQPEEIELIKNFYKTKKEEKDKNIIIRNFSGTIESLETTILSAIKEMEIKFKK